MPKYFLSCSRKMKVSTVCGTKRIPAGTRPCRWKHLALNAEQEVLNKYNTLQTLLPKPSRRATVQQFFFIAEEFTILSGK